MLRGMDASTPPVTTSSPSTPRPLPTAGLAVDAAWRAFAYCLHPRVIWLTLLPILLSATLLLGLAWWGWSDANEALRQGLDNWSLSQSLLAWLDSMGLQGLRAALVPVLLLILVVPLVVVLSLLLVAWMITPSVVKLVRSRRFPDLASRHQTSVWRSVALSLATTVVALGALVLTLPLWLIPVFALVVPPLIWGWLTYRVMAHDTLADFATPPEQDALIKRHRTTLLLMGVVCGYLGAAPAAVWALGVLAIVLAPFILVASLWLYTLVFVFSSLWFAHFLLAALAALRAEPLSTSPATHSRAEHA
jgi:Etoposide-induced protein 2.4 (EI24)